jgi:hypothetical protein
MNFMEQNMAKVKAPKSPKKAKAPKIPVQDIAAPAPSATMPSPQPQTQKANLLRQADLRAKFGLS